MIGYLLDTNVPSELTRAHSDPQVERWLTDAHDEHLYLSVISIGEIVKGIEVLPDSKRRRSFQDWMDETLRPWFDGRILPVNEAVAMRWGVLAGQRQVRVYH